MIKFRPRSAEPEADPVSTTVLGVGANFRGTLMVTGLLRIDGEFDAPLIWRRGGARYADGAPFAGEIASS